MCGRLDSVRRRSNPDCVVAAELAQAGIPVAPKADPHPACPLRVQGRLVTPWGEITFNREHRYWAATGFVPLAVAKTLYYESGEIGREEIRAGGHRHALPPEQFAVPNLGDPTALADLHALGFLLKHAADSDTVVPEWDPNAGSWESLDWGTWPRFERLADLCNAGRVGGERYVGVYHLDSQEALNRFAARVKAAGCAGKPGGDQG